MKNLFANLPNALSNEFVEVLAANANVRVERIVSIGQSSAEGFWYDQDDQEWVAVLQGEAAILFEGDSKPMVMRPGDHVLIAPHRRHRVEWTSQETPTIWLAVFFAAR
jgi:cupin 2 domain-containing protein